MSEPRPRTAEVAYAQARDRIRVLLAKLDEKLAAHEREHWSNPKNWGYAGDLNKIVALLEEACGETR